MVQEIRFILNNTQVETDLPPGTVLLDFIRDRQKLTGTKIGCREGDCGACTVLVGSLDEERVTYRTMTSCLMPLGNARGKHIVTVEGLNRRALTPIQQAIVYEGGTQCGFCTPGFVVSLAGFCLSDVPVTLENAIAAIDGNICRCTGYKSIERAAMRIVSLLSKEDKPHRLDRLTARRFLPDYFLSIPKRLKTLSAGLEKNADYPMAGSILLGGGTDLFVQKPEAMADSGLNLLFDRPELRAITRKNGQCEIGGAVTVSDLLQSSVMADIFPRLSNWMKRVSSTPIRNMATIAGNIVNASPIGDMTIFFLALESEIMLRKGKKHRTLPLKDFYKGYKDLNMKPGEILTWIKFKAPGKKTFFNFEKVCKRIHLDIASVNSAMRLEISGNKIRNAVISAGGVAPIPIVLEKTGAYLTGKNITEKAVLDAVDTAMAEIAPIDDIRGSAAYKRLLLRQLIYAHFHGFFPEIFQGDALR